MSSKEHFIALVKRLITLVWVLIICIILSALLYVGDSLGLFESLHRKSWVVKTGRESPVDNNTKSFWLAPDTSRIPHTPEGNQIRYGRELITHTALYLGPKGKVSAISNGLDCENCHLKAGTVPYGNNFGKAASTYPKFRNRSGSIVDFAGRINGCMERSLNGQKLDEDSREMKAMIAYLKWIGKDIKKDTPLKGFGLLDLKRLERPADPKKGADVFTKYCARCHGENGEGQLAENSLEWKYPPLYGKRSFNVGAGLYRLSGFAAFIKANMPYGVSFENPFLTDEEAWDVAAYVNSMERPNKDLSGDWPDISKKPFDHPFGPYADDFSEEQHKYGPFGPIEAAYK